MFWKFITTLLWCICYYLHKIHFDMHALCSSSCEHILNLPSMHNIVSVWTPMYNQSLHKTFGLFPPFISTDYLWVNNALSLSNGATAQGGPRPPLGVSSILHSLGRLLSSFYILASLHLPPLHLPNAVWVSLWGAFLLAHWEELSWIDHHHPCTEFSVQLRLPT